MATSIAHLIPNALAPGLRCRAAATTDEPFLRQLYASAREDAHAMGHWDAGMREAFMAMQYMARQRHYDQHYPHASLMVLEVDGQSVGQLWLDQNQHGVRVVDIAVLPHFRRRGIASACLRRVLELADAQALPVLLHVHADNPIRHWYAQLGFAVTDTPSPYEAMTRLPPGVST